MRIFGPTNKVDGAIASLAISVCVAEAELCGTAQTQVIYM